MEIFPRKETRGKEEGELSVPPHLTSPAPLQVFLSPSVFFFILFLFLIFDELVVAQGGRTTRVAGGGRRGAGVVLQPSGMRGLV